MNYRHDQWRALGTYVVLAVADGARLTEARARAEQVLDEVDLACSRFRDDSELSRANAVPGQWVPCSPVLVDAVRAAVHAAELTDGLVDPTLGLAIAAIGYDADLATVQARPAADPAALPEPPIRTGAWRELGVDPDGAVRVPHGVALDLGATGKAFAADRVAAAVAEAVGCGCIVSLGGDVAVGLSAADPPGGHPWQVSVSERPGEPAAETVTVRRGGIATSTTTHRTWQYRGATVHHLLDPRTGRPVEQVWRTATVCAPSCLEANAATTASLVLGADAPGWLTHRDLPGRLVAADGTVSTLGAWPELSPVEG